MSAPERKPLVPRLRFPEFREAGEWEVKPLSAIARITQGGTPCTSVSEYWGGSIQWVTPAEMGKEVSPYISKTARAITAEGLRNCSSELLPPNSVILSTRAPIGHLAINSVSMAINQGCRGIVVKSDCSAKFVYFSLGFCRARLESLGAGNTFKELSGNALKSFTFPIPQKDEQQKIADCLSSLDDLIAAETYKLDTLKTHKKGLMQQLFPREGELVPRVRFPEFREAGAWCEKPLSKVCNVLQGYGFPEVLQGKSEGKYPFCKVSDISRAVAEKGGVLDEATNYVGDDELLKLRAKPVPKGATVFAKIGEALRLNRRAYVQKECLIDNNATGLKAIDGIADDYFVYLLSQLIDLNRHCGGAVPSVNKTTLEEIEVVVPGLDEQKRIAENLSSLDDLITGQSQKIDALKTHKKGLMQQLFPVLDEVGA